MVLWTFECVEAIQFICVYVYMCMYVRVCECECSHSSFD